MTDYNDGKWHGWNGGECPVHPETVVTCMWQGKDGYFDGDTDKAKRFAWHDLGAFRVVKEHKEQKEYTIDPQEKIIWYNHHTGLIHVREVTE